MVDGIVRMVVVHDRLSIRLCNPHACKPKQRPLAGVPRPVKFSSDTKLLRLIPPNSSTHRRAQAGVGLAGEGPQQQYIYNSITTLSLTAYPTQVSTKPCASSASVSTSFTASHTLPCVHLAVQEPHTPPLQL